MSAIRYTASFITCIRIAGAFLLLLTKPLSASFFAVYILCCASDILDGYVARKTKTASKLGEILDSAADFIFVVIVLIIFIPRLALERWMLYWIGGIAVIRFASLGVGAVKYHAVTFLHTYANKAAGIVCACFPILYQIFGLPVTVWILCGAASLSAVEELAVSISSGTLDRNRRGLLLRETANKANKSEKSSF